MNDDETRRQLAQAAKTAQTVNLAQNGGAFLGFIAGGGLWLGLMYEPMDGSILWFLGGLVAALVGAVVVSRFALSLLAR
jgi:hypothetical protein